MATMAAGKGVAETIAFLTLADIVPTRTCIRRSFSRSLFAWAHSGCRQLIEPQPTRY